MSTSAASSAPRSCSTSSTGIDASWSPNSPSHGVWSVGGFGDERRELREPAGHDAATVEPDRRPERTAQRGEERDPSAEAEPDDADAVVGEARGAQVIERGVDIGEDRVVTADGAEQLDHLLHVAVSAVPPPARWKRSGATAW